MKTYNVFWSGGVDSTFVVTQLSQYPVTIRSFYVKGQTFRLSEPQEFQARKAIRELLIADPRTKAEILEPEIIEANDPRVKDREIINAARRIHIRILENYKAAHAGKLPQAGTQQIYVDKAYFPSQNTVNASLAKYYNETFEMGTLLYDFNKHPAFGFEYVIKHDDTTDRDVLYLDEDRCSDEDKKIIYRHLSFPIIGQKMNKPDVWQWYTDHGYEAVRAKTNFCQAPVFTGGDVEPCGICTACIGVIQDGLLEPFTEAGLARYRDYVENHEKEPERFRLKGF